MSGVSPDLEERVGAAVDADQHGLELTDVRPQHPEVLLVVVAAHHHERVATGEGGPQLRELDRREHEVGLALDVLEGVLGEALELGADAGTRLLHPSLDLVLAEHVTGAELLVAGEHGAAVEAHRLPVDRRRP